MRRMCLIGACCVAAQLTLPSSAHAWWEYIEAFSGPAFKWGWNVELRLACFTAADPNVTRAAVRTTATALQLVSDTQTNAARSLEALGGKATPEAMNEVVSDWRAGIDSFRRAIAQSLALVQPADPTAFEITLASAAAAQARALQQAEQFPRVEGDARMRLFALAVTELDSASRDLLTAGTLLQDASPRVRAALPAAGLFFSACPIPKDHFRRSSIDIGFHYTRSTATEEFAAGQQVTLIMLMPSYSWRLTPYVDGGTAGGVYWFTSPGFTPGAVPPDGLPASAGLAPFKGVVLEPVRFDLHWRRDVSTLGHALRSGVVVRLGMYWFPGGFDLNAFGNNQQKPGELQKRIALLYDVEPFRAHCSSRDSWICKVFRQ